jgi:copper(I)-binding protein
MLLKPIAFAASVLLAGAAAAQTAVPANQNQTHDQNQIQLEDAWARATPAKAENGAAYLTIVSPTPDRLTGVSTPVAKKAGLHSMTMEGGIMRMRPLAGIDLPAGQPVALKPGGMHIMLMGLDRQLMPGEHFPLTLSFEKAGQRQVEVAVEKAGAMGPEHQSGGGVPAPSGH